MEEHSRRDVPNKAMWVPKKSPGNIEVWEYIQKNLLLAVSEYVILYYFSEGETKNKMRKRVKKDF